MYQLTITSEHDDQPEVSSADSVTSMGPAKVRAQWSQPPRDLVRVTSAGGAFSIWPDEVREGYPIVLARLGVAVTLGEDERSYTELLDSARASGAKTALADIADGPETTFEEAASRSRELQGPIWLGLGRDLRTFGSGFRSVGSGTPGERMWDWIAPQWHGTGVVLDEEPSAPIRYQYMIGRGLSSQQEITRQLRERVLPILEAEIVDGPLTYRATQWVALERSSTTAATNTGSDFLLADGHSAGKMFTPEQQQRFDRLQADYRPAEETVLFLRVEVTNGGAAPRHAFVKLPEPFAPDSQHRPVTHSFDRSTGFSAFSADRVFAITSVNGAPAELTEISPVLVPGETLVVDIRIPHRPITPERAVALAGRNPVSVLEEVTDYWRGRLSVGASIRVPEPRIDEMVRAGLLHLDLVTYGLEPDGAVAPTIGVYAPIGSESGPIMQFYDSLGWSELAERSLQYFIEKQHDDGFMQNFGGYMLETEAALWSFGEHYRYTRDEAWVERILPNLDGAVEYILRNREQQRAEGREPHGLIVGKTADPEDPFASYMLNGFAALGLARAAEMVEQLDPERSQRWRAEADSLRQSIRDSLAEAMAASPVVPLSDGTWSRTAPPWAGHPGPLALDRSGANWYTHGTITARDALLGPLWLATQEVLEPGEQVTTELLEYHADLLFHDNAAFSQPYYSTHQLTHLRRGEVKEFLRPYYTTMAALADRQTYSFWEHYFHASPHKTHEEAWFLMQTRWMLWLEDGTTLRLFPGIPRAWMTAGERLALAGVRSHFGPVDATAQVADDGASVAVTVRLDAARAPQTLCIRLPHPEGARQATVSAGEYDPQSETLTLAVAETSEIDLTLTWL